MICAMPISSKIPIRHDVMHIVGPLVAYLAAVVITLQSLAALVSPIRTSPTTNSAASVIWIICAAFGFRACGIYTFCRAKMATSKFQVTFINFIRSSAIFALANDFLGAFSLRLACCILRAALTRTKSIRSRNVTVKFFAAPLADKFSMFIREPFGTFHVFMGTLGTAIRSVVMGTFSALKKLSTAGTFDRFPMSGMIGFCPTGPRTINFLRMFVINKRASTLRADFFHAIFPCEAL